ncbi:hypothetical protein [Pyxidicoccus xibeiensis]|uniref:hypothetical protein n=1 Tax=Pyxidicoccus xibeiensis TaxID=2906759 RepID=UPI0020A70BFB|nr:hypothetical protein [Pyxidicoccus xibeiensis]MCP3140087.1 hypothetical protein [Pyxidicoccus xibeiensis]
MSESMVPPSITTRINLPPVPPTSSEVRALLRRIFEDYRWFHPVRYDRFGHDGRLDPRRIDYDALVASYEEKRSLMVLAWTDRDFISLSPTRPGAPPFVGQFAWYTAASEANKTDWQRSHLQQVVELMGLLGASLARTGLADDFQRKGRREVPSPDGIGSIETFTVRDPSEGLAGLYWRNFFGPPFVRMFGDRLRSLPPGASQELGSDIVLVQPYELPTQAMTPEGDAAEQRLITVLGPECFYDHEQHRKPTRVPDLSTGSP